MRILLRKAEMHPEVMKATDLLQINTPECFEEAVRLLRHTVYRFSVKICRHPEDAEDTTQEVIFRSLRHFGRFKDPQSLSVWLYVVTRNRYRRMRRQNAHCLARVIPLDQLLLTREETTPLLTDIRKSPEATMLRTEESRLLHRAILRIPVPLRTVLVLHDLEEFSTTEIAERFALSPGTIRVRLHRARLRARKELDTLLAKKPEVGETTRGKLKCWCS